MIELVSNITAKLQLSPTKSLTQAYHLISPLNWATTILPVSFARLVPTSLHNHIRPLNLVPLLLNHVHPRSGTNCPSKLSPHNHSRLSRAGLKLTISVSHLPRSRASPRLRFVPYCSHELTVLDPGVFKLSLLLLLLLLYKIEMANNELNELQSVQYSGEQYLMNQVVNL